MTTARELMTPNAEYADPNESVQAAAQKMAQQGVGSLPIKDEDDRLHGMLTDRDVVVKVLAAGQDGSSQVSGLAQGKTITVEADDTAEEVLSTMSQHQIRRTPVLDNGKFVGIVAQADVARSLSNPSTGDLLEALSYE